MTMYLLDKGVGVSDGAAAKNTGTLEIEFKGASVDGVLVGGKAYSVVGGLAAIPTEGLEGVVNITARNGVTRRAYACDNLLFTDDLIIPMLNFTPAEYAEMAATAERTVAELAKKIEILEGAVFGIPLLKGVSR